MGNANFISSKEGIETWEEFLGRANRVRSADLSIEAIYRGLGWNDKRRGTALRGHLWVS